MFDLYRLLLPLDNSLSIQSSRFMSWVLAVFQGCFCTYVYARTSPIQVHSTLKTYCPASSILYRCYWLSFSLGIAIFAVLTLYYCCFEGTHFRIDYLRPNWLPWPDADISEIQRHFCRCMADCVPVLAWCAKLIAFLPSTPNIPIIYLFLHRSDCWLLRSSYPDFDFALIFGVFVTTRVPLTI